jgi:ubiquinone/menaquinone biosynthesis C-methylase UbiE
MIKLPFWVFRGLYWYLDKLDKDHQLVFMNYGYSDPETKINLDREDEKNRYPIQLYHHMAEMADLKDRKIVEVGSGRGGGLAYVTRRFSPKYATGIDIEMSAVAFSNKNFRQENLEYVTGNAQSLPLPDESCDVVLNVESSHRYLSVSSFVTEVYRVLNPGGLFLFTDFRPPHQWPEMMSLLENKGFRVLVEKDITENVIRSLEKDTERRATLVKKYAPRILQKSILNFTGARGTSTYEYFQSRKFIYKSFLLQRNSTDDKPAPKVYEG